MKESKVFTQQQSPLVFFAHLSQPWSAWLSTLTHLLALLSPFCWSSARRWRRLSSRSLLAHRLALLIHSEIVRLVREVVELIDRERAYHRKLRPFSLEGVDSNSASRIRSVSSLTLTIERMSFFVPSRHVESDRSRRNPWMRAAKRSAAATIPSGRRPRTIQSRCIRLVMRSAVRHTAESWSPNSIWEAKRLM